MSALTDRIASEHDTYLTYLHGGNLRASCEGCDWTFEGDSIDAVMECSRHVATVTEAAVREQVAQDIETARSEAAARIAESHLPAWQEALANAARIARGEQ